MHRVLVGLAIAAALGMLSIGQVASAQSSYLWSIDGSVQNSGLPAGLAPGVPLGPNVTSEKGGARIEIAGSGKFAPSSHWIDGGGDYRIVRTDGSVLKQGRWKPIGLTSYRDLGTEPEGSPVENLRSGIIRAPILLAGLGRGSLVFLCGTHDSNGEEVEGVKVTIRRLRFDHIDAGSTTIETQ